MNKFDDFQDFEDISSKSNNYLDDDFEDFDSGRYTYDDDYAYADGPGISMSKQSKYETDEEIRRKNQVRMNIKQNRQIEYEDEYDDDEYEDIDTRRRQPRKKRRHRHISLRRRIFRAIGIAFLLFIALIGILIFSVYNKLSHDEGEKHVNQYIDESELYSDKGVYNLLLLGVDAREGESVSRSDTMMLISVDKNNKKIKMTSFLRDSYVEIPGYGFTKLNAACSQGGVDLVWDTIEYNYKIKIDNYMMVDFIAFEELIDALGGVDVNITETEANYLNNTWYEWTLTGNELHFDSGEEVHLNGEQALMFCRIRKLDSDFMRTDRQRRTISGIKSELLHTNPFELIKLSNKVLPNVTTDLSSGKVIKLGTAAIFKYLRYDMQSLGCPIDGTWHNEMNRSGACLVFDIPQQSELLIDYIYNDVYPLEEESE